MLLKILKLLLFQNKLSYIASSSLNILWLHSGIAEWKDSHAMEIVNVGKVLFPVCVLQWLCCEQFHCYSTVVHCKAQRAGRLQWLRLHCSFHVQMFMVRLFHKCLLPLALLSVIFRRKKNSAIQPPFPSIHHTCQSASCCIYRNGGVIFWQLSCHILENVNECVCKIKFMGCQRRIRTRRAITSLLSSFELWYIKQKTMQLNVGISIVQVLEWMGQCLFLPFLALCFGEQWN